MSSAAIETGNFEILRATEILRGAADATVEKIAAAAELQTVEEGTRCIRWATPRAALMCWLPAGCGSILGGDGRPTAQGTIIRAGDILGWAALLGNQPRRIASVIALEDCLLLSINGEALLRILDQGRAPDCS